MKLPGSICPLNQSFVAGKPFRRYWISSWYQNLPQWAWVHFGGSRRIDKVVLYAHSFASRPVEITGQYLPNGAATFHTIFHVRNARFDRRTLSCTIRFKPVVAGNFRLLIQRVAASATPQSWVAELARLQVFGVNAPAPRRDTVAPASDFNPSVLNSNLHRTRFVPEVKDSGQTVAIRTPWYRLVLDKSHPRIVFLSWDSLGHGKLKVNFLHPRGAGPQLQPWFHKLMSLGRAALVRTGNVFHYPPVEIAPGAYEQMSIRADRRGFALGLAAAADRHILMRGGLFRFHLAPNETPMTFVCHPPKVICYAPTPCYLVAPDFGMAYITSTGDPTAFFRTPSGLFPATTDWIDIMPHRPTTEDGLSEIGPTPWHVVLHFALQRVEPIPALTSRNPRLKRLPKYCLDGIQWRADTGMLSNSVMSLNCGLALMFYAQEAVFVPHLKNGISPMAMVAESVQRYFQGASGYMMPFRNVCDPHWHSSRETAAYLVISAWYVIRTIGGVEQLHHWLKPLECLGNHIASKFDSDGVINNGNARMWFDTYNMQGADAYSNAADYKAFRCLADLETLASRPEMARRYRADAARIKAAYMRVFFDPRTGVLAGWRSDDGKLHDYMFPWVNGYAICRTGLVPHPMARAILERLLVKMRQIGFHSYRLGLPTNLIPFSPAGYVPHTSGAPRDSNGMDTWQIYMNGGATPAFDYYFIQALYKEGLHKQAEHLLWALVASYERGTFNAGFGERGYRQRNPVGSAFYVWNGSRGAGEGYLPEDWDGLEAIFTGHYGIGFDKHGYFLEPWSPLKGQAVKLDLPYMGKLVPYIK